jgi:hypothetical protein
VVVLLSPVEASHLEAVAETLKKGLPESVAQRAPLQGAFQLLPAVAVARELYPEHDPVLFLQVVVLPSQLKISYKGFKLNTQCLHGNYLQL